MQVYTKTSHQRGGEGRDGKGRERGGEVRAGEGMGKEGSGGKSTLPITNSWVRPEQDVTKNIIYR